MSPKKTACVEVEKLPQGALNKVSIWLAYVWVVCMRFRWSLRHKRICFSWVYKISMILTTFSRRIWHRDDLSKSWVVDRNKIEVQSLVIYQTIRLSLELQNVAYYMLTYRPMCALLEQQVYFWAEWSTTNADRAMLNVFHALSVTKFYPLH